MRSILVCTSGFCIAMAHGLALGSPPTSPQIGSTPTVFSATATGGSYGSALTPVGDVNGDGYADFVLTDFLAEQPGDVQSDEGVVFGFYGSATGVSTTPNWSVDGDVVNVHFGVQASGAGDVNGDGFDDVLVCAPNYANGQTKEGQVRLYFGSASGLSTTAGWLFESDTVNSEIGTFLAALGDVNGDGFADLGMSDKNMALACAFYGSATTPPTTPNWTFASIGQGQGGMAGVGDVNGDGFDDIIVGGLKGTGSATLQQTWLFRGSATGLSLAPFQTFTGAASCLGLRVAAGGDINGDGNPDVVTGDVCTDSLKILRGAGSGLLQMLPPANLWKPSDALDFPRALAGGADADGDGFADVLVGDPTAKKAWLFRGTSKGLAADPAWTANAPVDTTVTPVFGTTVAFAGDVDADGDSEILISDPDADSVNKVGVDAFGRVYEYAGAPVNADDAVPTFVSGDTLVGALAAQGDDTEANFAGVKGMKLVLAFAAGAGQKLTTNLIDPTGKQESSFDVTLGAAGASKTIKFKRSGLYRLEFALKKGANAALSIVTSRELPKNALARTVNVALKVGANNVALDFLAIGGATFDADLLPAVALTNLSAGVTTPAGSDLSIAAFTTGDPTHLVVAAVPLNATGKFRLRIHADSTAKTSLAVTLTPNQPAVGSATVNLP